MLQGRILALDVGKVRIGVAVTDPLRITANPLLTIYRKSRGEDFRNLVRLARQQEAVRILVGNPLHLSGDISPWAVKVHEFTAELRTRIDLPIELVDERLSSVAAHELLDEAGHSKRDRKPVLDQYAAVIILRTWMQTQPDA